MEIYTESVTRLIEEFTKLPGIGNKSAERLADYILRVSPQTALSLAHAIEEVKEKVGRCKTCYSLSESEFCSICSNVQRDHTTVCVVEQARDILAIERAGTFRGVYHVLGGRIAPLEGLGPDELTVDELFRRVRLGEVREIILGTNPTLEGDGTALFISQQLADSDVKITRLARGLATGMVLEFANKEMLADALANRRDI